MPELTLEQQRASYALKEITEFKKCPQGHYVSYVSAMPAQIISSGLGQTLATLLAAAGRTKVPHEDPHFALCLHVTKWLKKQITELSADADDGSSEPIQVLRLLMTVDQRTFLRAQTESLLYLDWLKKFARALLKQEESLA